MGRSAERTAGSASPVAAVHAVVGPAGPVASEGTPAEPRRRRRHQSGEISTRRLPGLAPARQSTLPVDAAACRIVEALVQAGVDTFFGIPGGPAAPLFEAVRMHDGARLIESRHESGAAFAAAAFYRASGRVPAVLVTAGPGITNAVTGIASGSLERCPMVVLCGDVAWATTGGCLAQDSGPNGIDAERMLSPMTRLAVRVARPESAASQVLAALQAATHPLHPGPALCVVPIDRAMASAPPAPALPAVLSMPTPVRIEPVEQAAALLAAAQRPLLVVGAGCRGHETSVRELADVLNVPFVTTPRAKGLLSEAHPRSLRNGGMAASMWARSYTAGGVDVALVLGTDLDDTSMGCTPYIGAGGQLIHVDNDPRVFQRNLPTALPVVADVGSFASALRAIATERGQINPHGRSLMRAARAVSAFDDSTLGRGREGRAIAPQTAVLELQAAAGERARFITDIGEHMLFVLHYFTAKAPDSFQIQLNLGSMGSGIAGAIGLALADRSRPVVCICGDGCMQMAGMETLVAVRERLPIVFAVFNDSRYNMVHHGMNQIFGEAEAWESPPVDFRAWAHAIGLSAAQVQHEGEIGPGMLESLGALDGPVLLDIRIDRDQRVRGGGRVEALQHMSMLRAGGA